MGIKKLATNAILNTAKTVLGILFPLITYPYVARVLGVDNLGIYSFSVAFVSYFQLIAALGVSTYGIREGTQYRDDKVQFEQFISELFSINMISTLVAYCLLIVLLYVIPYLSPYRTVIIILSFEIIFTTVGVAWVCNIYEDFWLIAVRTILFQIISLILTFLLIRTSDDLSIYVGILLLSNSGANILNFFYIRKKYCKFYFTTRIDWKRHLKPILVIFSTSVAITVYVSSDATMLGFMTNDYQVGLYGTAVKIYTIIKNILAAVLMVTIPRFTLMYSIGDQKKLDEFFSYVFNILTVLMVPMCVGLFALSDDIVLLMFGQSYIGAASPLRFLSIAVIFSLYAFMFTQCILIPSKEENVVFRATVTSAIVNIILNYIMIPILGIDAAAITTIIAEFITFIITYFYSRNRVRLFGVGANMISTIIGCVCIFVICSACRLISSLPIRVVAAILCSVFAYTGVLVITRNTMLAQVKVVMRGKK